MSPMADGLNEDVETLKSKFLGDSMNLSKAPEVTESGSFLIPAKAEKTTPKETAENPCNATMSAAVQPPISPTDFTKKIQSKIKAELLIAIPTIFIKKLLRNSALF